ncbi:HD domain-containing protein [Xanthomonas campestris pv. clerodendri]|uniref:HD domain-containing protein n=1 Tax=Xanthomonas euvesicatoria TaxID=456327 RepID=UPI001C47261E|nr:HD domain-containing protein [Xanthomonas euvesicatoria]MBV6791815.1 HD domain-containing protein [Xanthomonas campestris pv. clerodendri]
MKETNSRMADDDWFVRCFGRYEELARTLLPHAIDPSAGDGSHDLAHLARVWRNAERIARAEGGDGEILTAAVLMHDCVAVEKSSPLRSRASRLAAERASDVLQGLGWSQERSAAVAHAIEAHSFSAGIEPQTLEARIVQDADRLDALGMVGVARCFYIAGRMGSSLYDPADTRGSARTHDDARYALDHFPRKLLRLADGFRTHTGAAIAVERHQKLQDFYEDFVLEVSGG